MAQIPAETPQPTTPTDASKVRPAGVERANPAAEISKDPHFINFDDALGPACAHCGGACRARLHKGSGLTVWRCANEECFYAR